MRLVLKWLYILLLISFSVHSSEFFAILIGDTSEKTIANVVKYDIKAMKAEVRSIAKCAGQKLNLVVLHGSTLNLKNLQTVFDQLNPGLDDTVFFYQSSHGFRSPYKGDKWPILFFSDDNIGIYFDSINHLLLRKNPRLLISIINACNSKAPKELIYSEKSFQIIARSKQSMENEKQGYRQLFTTFRGSIIASSSQPGEQSFGIDHGGSFFTVSFIDALKKAVHGEIPCDWRDVMSEAAAGTKRRAKTFHCSQHPQFIINSPYAKGADEGADLLNFN